MKKFFETPVNGSNFNAELGEVAGAELLGISYDRRVYRFSPIDAAGNRIIGDLSVSTDPVETPVSEATAAADIRAQIAATNA